MDFHFRCESVASRVPFQLFHVANTIRSRSIFLYLPIQQSRNWYLVQRNAVLLWILVQNAERYFIEIDRMKKSNCFLRNDTVQMHNISHLDFQIFHLYSFWFKWSHNFRFRVHFWSIKDSAKIITFIRIFAHFCMNLTDLNKLTFERTFDSRCTYWTSWTDNSDGNLSVFVAPQCMLLGSNSLHVGDFRCIFCQNPDFNSSFLTGGYKDSAQTPSAPIPSKKLEKFQINVFLFPFFV